MQVKSKYPCEFFPEGMVFEAEPLHGTPIQMIVVTGSNGVEYVARKELDPLIYTIKERGVLVAEFEEIEDRYK